MKSTNRICSALAIAVLLLATRPASADFEIRLSDNNFSTYSTVVDNTNNAAGGTTLTGSFNGFTYSFLNGTSNSPGSDVKAVLDSSTASITNNNSTTETLYISIGAQDFTAPVTPPALILSSHIGTTVITGQPGDTLTFQSFVDTANGQNTTTGYTPGPQSLNLQGPNSPKSDAYAAIASLSANYSMTEYFKVTLAAGDSFNFSTNTQVSTPEPASMTLWGLGLAVCGLVARRRRRV
ncbi:MAG TPA: PEP-CTERM sorting domain-containing protein [Pirellulales bacterium]|nr:PEP-CTERM sorting domain-containing protein [Pirellulales bacterium]